MRHNRLSLPVNRRFEHHFVVRIGQLRPPYEPNFHRINTHRQFRKKPGRFSLFAIAAQLYAPILCLTPQER
jgi:hypothetical protein